MQINGVEQVVFGSLIAVCGDNLSSHAIGGFQEYFNSGRICRFCMACKEDIRGKSREDAFVLRSPSTHEKHLKAGKIDPQFQKVYGVYKENILNDLQHFHVTTALPPDFMHDMLEGLLIFAFTHFICYLLK